jgi:Cu/Ag efflux protein CusF
MENSGCGRFVLDTGAELAISFTIVGSDGRLNAQRVSPFASRIVVQLVTHNLPGAAMKRLITLVAATALSAAAFAQTGTEGEVRKIDKAQGKVTLKHAEIRQLEMPAMTMVFKVSDPKMLEGLEEGAKVSFVAAKVKGEYTVTFIKRH